MNAKITIIIGALILSLIGTSTYAIRSYMESPKDRAERMNLSTLKKCLDDAREIGVLEEAMKATRNCPKIEMIQVITPNSSGTVTPASSGVPGGNPSLSSYPLNSSYELKGNLHSDSEKTSDTLDTLHGSHQALGQEVEGDERSSSGGSRESTETYGDNGENEKKRTSKNISSSPILSVLSLDSCYVSQYEDSHVTKRRGHVYATDIACGGKSFTVSAPLWKKSYKVIAVGLDSKLGNYIVLENGNYRFVFGHTQSPHKVGDTVTGGTQIGYTNLSGITEGMHVHFELWRDGYNITHEEMIGKGSMWNDEYSFRLLVQRGWYTGIDDAIEFISAFEGFHDTAYEDPKGSGRWSIGYGTKASSPGEKITQSEAKQRIYSKVFDTLDFIYRKRLGLTPNERIATASFFYNLGTGRPEMIQSLKKRDIDSLEKLWKSYIMKGTKYEKGLTTRRTKEWSKFTSQK